MTIVENPVRGDWAALVERPKKDAAVLEKIVRQIIENVRQNGDRALLDYATQFDGAQLERLQVNESEITEAIAQIPAGLKQAIGVAARNISTFHESQKRAVVKIDTMPGVVCWRKCLPIERVGIYIPGGSAPLFSTVLMLGIPAQIAGCTEIILCTPPDKGGMINPAILYTARLCGIERVFKIGGAQAIAAMAYETESVPRCFKIFGPGNRYVTLAKQIVSMEGIAIDMPAGPSEVLVLADKDADASFVAADLLSQAEHGPDSQVILVTINAPLIERVQKEIEAQLKLLPRKEIASAALEESRLIYFDNETSAIQFTNMYAPEHLIINMQNARDIADQVYNAGSVFVGPYSAEAVGDYASGTNHTLPTNGAAKAWSGVSVESFQHTISFQEITREGLANLGGTIETMASAEQLEGHRRAISIRRNKLKI